MPEYSAKHYIDVIRRELPDNIFQRVPSRLLWLPAHLVVIALMWRLILFGELHWGVKVLCALVIGHSYAVLGFLGHEILHGAVVRRGPLQTFFSWLCLLPYWIGPEHWRAWHNREHHGHTSRPGSDPDSLANYPIYSRSRVLRFIESITPGSRLLRSFFYFFYFLSLQSVVVLFHHGKVRNYWPRGKRLAVVALFWLNVLTWVGIGVLVGPLNLLFLFVVPMMVANFINMSYIATNHFLNAQTPKTNDPLVNSLSVRVGRVIEFLHLGFNYHVEHHVIPSMSPRHAPAVRAVLKKHFPDRYREMPLWRAWYLLFACPHVHWTDDTTVNPRTGELFTTQEAHREPQPLGRLPRPIPGARRKAPLEMLESRTAVAEERMNSAGEIGREHASDEEQKAA